MGKEGRHSVTTTWQEIAAYDPDVIVLMPCGYHLKESLAEVQRHAWPPEWKRLRVVREGQVYAVDGSSYYNRPGPRVVDGLEILAEILHPEIFPRKHTKDDWVRL
jgi:iron complex transport system substrate-binding protein